MTVIAVAPTALSLRSSPVPLLRSYGACERPTVASDNATPDLPNCRIRLDVAVFEITCASEQPPRPRGTPPLRVFASPGPAARDRDDGADGGAADLRGALAKLQSSGPPPTADESSKCRWNLTTSPTRIDQAVDLRSAAKSRALISSRR